LEYAFNEFLEGQRDKGAKAVGYVIVVRVVEAGINGDETLDDIVADWNAAWDAAVDACAPQ
jgi:hypothetical protein